MDCQSFKPLARKDAEILILGSLPGGESLRLSQYYANKSNKFWSIMLPLVGEATDLAYTAKLRALTSHKIAVWDVCASAFRIGSLDSSINPSSIVANDFASFFVRHRKIKLICFNGSFAEKLFLKAVLPDLPASLHSIKRVRLPSTSPAHASLTFPQKLKLWHAALMPFMVN